MELRTKKLKKNDGFTIMEMLVVVGVLGLISVIGSNFFFSSLFGTSKSETLKEVKQNGEYSLKVMEETIKNAYGFVSCDNQSITVKNKDNQRNTFRFESVSSIGRIASDSSYLTSEKVTVTNFLIDCEPTPGIPPKIVISFTVSQTEQSSRPEKKATFDFNTTVTMRNY